MSRKSNKGRKSKVKGEVGEKKKAEEKRRKRRRQRKRGKKGGGDRDEDDAGDGNCQKSYRKCTK